MLREQLKNFGTYSLRDKGFALVRKCYYTMAARRRLHGKYIFDDRQKHAENLLLIVAGFQPYYWDSVMERVAMNERQFFEPLDVCVCVPKGEGDAHEVLRKICEKHGWSCLFYKRDLLGAAQNIAIDLHKSASYIFKIDEDIILPEHYFERMKAAYARADNGPFPVRAGFLGPCINVNHCGAPVFLKTVGKFQECEEKFGRYSCDPRSNGDKIHKSPDMAVWIWEQSLPFDAVADKVFAANRDTVSICAQRFSIGAVLFERWFWEKMGYFEVDVEGALGPEEVQMNNYCQNNFSGVFLANGVLVGHLGFYTQKQAVRAFYEQHRSEIDPIPKQDA